MRNPHSLHTAIMLLGPLAVASIVITLHFSKLAIGVVMMCCSAYFLRKGGVGSVKLGPGGLSMRGSFACLLLIGGFVLVLTGGNDMRTEFSQAVAQEVKKLPPSVETNTSRQADLK
ncbi:hypothetical protein RAD16_05215 [Bradyrhizobium sp. 18BD]